MTHTLCRSVLFMPASNARAMEKAKSLDIDVVVFDLEDATAPDVKTQARARAATAIEGGGYGRRKLAIRINGLDTDWWREDIAAACAAGADILIVPKINSASDVRAVFAEQGDVTIPIWAMLETPQAIVNAADIGAVGAGLQALVLGTNDLTKELRAKHVPGRAPVLAALSIGVLAARAHGLLALDGVYNAIGDDAGFLAECDQGRAMGFDGKSLIHPSQIAGANAAFSPSDEEIADARALIDTYERAKAASKGVVTYKGKMIEALHVEEAHRLLALAALIAS